MAQALGKLCALQRQYGKATADLETLVEGFAWVLADYPVHDVLRGMGVYLKTKSDIPTPSEIIAIIDPQPEPFKPDWVYFKTLKDMAKIPYALGDEEIEYIGKCERHSLDKAKASHD